MKYKFFVLIGLLVTLFVVANSLAAAPAAGPATHKQIAVAPADMHLQQLPDPASNGTRSHSALLPVELSYNEKTGWQWSQTVPVDGSEQLSFMLLAPSSENWTLSAQAPGQNLQALGGQVAGVSQELANLGMGNNQFAGQVYTVEAPTNGQWTVQINSPSTPAANTTIHGYLLVSSDSPYRLYSNLTSYNLLVGQTIGFQTALVSENSNDPLAGSISQASLSVQTPDGRELYVPFTQDLFGSSNSNGRWQANFTADAAGTYIAQITATGTDPDGRAFIRTSEHAFPVLEPSISLSNGLVRSRNIDGTRWQLDINANTNGNHASQLLVSAELWGTDANGTAVPITWLSGIVSPQTNGSRLTLPLTLDGRWVELAGAKAPFELRQLRVQDVDTAVPLSQIDKLPLQLNYRLGTLNVNGISQEMLMGAAPEAVGNPAAAGRVMLVHGYCSGGVWPTSNFSQYAVFSDHNQNRSHDQFAQLIRNYGNNFSSFGTVAHSQGGAASLHLYTYYWSGFDYSSGNRLIQSVGTPYQGTSLAGSLAAIGAVFGVGCGTNWDLTYDGASLWLSGIPSWARSRVYYYTTSFEDVWWRYDYCHIASDLILDDPDDGTTERWAGQLSGGNNMGHKTGWCHTTSMRDPGQTTDYSRNVNMNANANR